MSESVRLDVTAEDDVRMVVVKESDDGQCSICLENVQEGRQTLPCGHEFHEDCLREWLALQNTCPVCRAALPLPKKTASITRDHMMKFFFLKSVILMITFVNYYLLQYIMDEVNGFHQLFGLVIVVIIVDVLILFSTMITIYGIDNLWN
jgi:ABC-type bacteriocin/lantibiotic exporter with double-glycine peptidase domain